MKELRDYIAERNARAAETAIRDAGYEPILTSYDDVSNTPDIGPRHFVLVTWEGFRYQAQWHRRATHGTSFMASRGDGWNEDAAKRLSTIAEASAPTGSAEDES